MADTQTDAYEQQLRGSDGAGSVGAYLGHRAKPHLPPWLAVIGAGITSVPAHLLWDDNAAATAGLTLASVALTSMTWWAGKATTAQRRLHSAITVACSTGWITAAAIAGPGAGPLLSLYFIGGPTLALSWNIRQILRRNPDALGSGSDGGLLEKVGLAKTLVTGSDVAPNKATFDLQLPRGELTHDDATKAVAKLASALDVAPTAVRMVGDPDSASRAQLTVVPHDLLKNTVPNPGPSSPGGSIADPVVTGIYEDGTHTVLLFPGDSTQARNAMHLLIMGMTGSGKSEGGITALAEILTRRDVVVWVSDPAKADQTLGPLLPAIDWAALDVKSTGAMLEALKAVIPARTRWLAKYGYKQWEPTCATTQADGEPGMPYLVAWFEEAAKTLREIDEDAFTGIAQEARSAGVSLVVSLQRASGTQMSTDTRASLGSSWCFGVRSDTDAGFALPGEVLDAGASPHAWKDKKPGYAYLVANGVPETFWVTPARSYLTGREYLDWVVIAFADTRSGLDPTTAKAAAKAAGKSFTQRTRYPLPGATAAPVIGPDQELDMDDGTDDRHQHDDQVDDGYDDDDLDDIDPEDELPDVTHVVQLSGRPPAKPRTDVTPEQARQVMEQLLTEFEDEGRAVVGPKDFMEHCDRHGRSRQWISGQIPAFVMAGRLAETDVAGRYRIVRDEEAA